MENQKYGSQHHSDYLTNLQKYTSNERGVIKMDKQFEPNRAEKQAYASGLVLEDLAGKKNDTGKAPVSLISSVFIFEVAKVLDFGQKKYSSWNWKKGFIWSRVISAVLRHIFQWLAGEDKDSETGLSHLSHAACGLMFLIDFEQNKIGIDDRYKSEIAPDIRRG